jgi:hypothetical protein
MFLGLSALGGAMWNSGAQACDWIARHILMMTI